MPSPTRPQRSVMMRHVTATLGLSVALLWLAPPAATRPAPVKAAAHSAAASADIVELPYKGLLDAKVKFYASLGNHDDREGQRYYQLFNMNGKLYYSFKAPKQSVRFFALDSTYADPEESAWLEKELAGSGEDWKIPY